MLLRSTLFSGPVLRIARVVPAAAGLALAPALAAAEPLAIGLNEVLYDPDGADTGLEFVELAARSGLPDDLSLEGWTLETGNGARPGEWRAAWTGGPDDRLSGGLFLVGEAAVEPRPDAVVDLDLQNGPDACRLRAPGGATDVLGWGEPLDPSFYEGAPAEDVVGGLALARFPDGLDRDDNAADFHAAEPSPGEFNAPARAVRVDGFSFVPEDGPPGAAATATWTLRNVGREPWSGEVRLGCAVHPGEELLRHAAPAAGVPLAPGDFAIGAARAVPPSGDHLPLPDPGPAARGGPGGPGGGEEGGTAVPPGAGGGSDLLLSEALNRPAPGGVEWVEIESVASRAVDLGAFRLRDAAGTTAGLAGVLEAGEWAIVTPDTLALAAEWNLPPTRLLVAAAPWPSLNHTGNADEAAERLFLILADLETATASLPGGADEGVAWERISRELPGDDIGAWAPSLDTAGGTPGRLNSRHGDRPAPARGSGSLAVTPVPFRPDRDGTVLLVLRSERPVATLRFGVFDASGRRVAELAPWAASAGEVRALWDGRAADGSPAGLGLYLAVAEGAGRRPEQAPIVVVR